MDQVGVRVHQDYDLMDEAERVTAWRFDTLADAGYPVAAAADLATNPDVDVHAAVRLLVRGCPVKTALRILR